MEKYLQKLAFNYLEYMSKRSVGESKETLRTILARNYHELKERFKELVDERFPHISYGQDKESKTFKKSFPPSYKRYFFKLVKNIIIKKKNGKKVGQLLKHPPSLTMTVGTRANTLADQIPTMSKNTRLNHFKVSKEIKTKFQKEPDSFRPRVFKRREFKEKYMKNVFMTFEEIENCTFEPNCGTQNPLNKNAYDSDTQNKDGDGGPTFFEKMGENFLHGYPKIYKQGILKKSLLKLKNGNREDSFNLLFDAFYVEKVFAHFQNKEYQLWQEARGLKTDNMKKVENRMKAMAAMGLGKEGEEAPQKEEPKRTASEEKRIKDLNEKHKFIFGFLDKIHEKCEDVIRDHREHPEKKTVYVEKFEEKGLEAMYLEAMDLLKTHIKMNKEEFDRKEACQKKKKSLEDIKRTLKDQKLTGYEENDDNDEIDYRKLYKTIMCPLKHKCSKVRYQRWPSSNIKSFTNFGKECPYAHHPMEL